MESLDCHFLIVLLWRFISCNIITSPSKKLIYFTSYWAERIQNCIGKYFNHIFLLQPALQSSLVGKLCGRLFTTEGILFSRKVNKMNWKKTRKGKKRNFQQVNRTTSNKAKKSKSPAILKSHYVKVKIISKKDIFGRLKTCSSRAWSSSTYII